MHPLLHFGLGFVAFDVKSYSLFLTLAAVLTVAGAWVFAVRRGMPRWRVAGVLAAAALAGFAGARLLHAATHLAAYRAEPWRLYSPDFNGLALFGGMAAAVAVGWLACRAARLDARRLADSVAIPLGLGIAVARVGCYLNGCCFGKVTTMPWSVRFPFLSEPHLYQLTQGTGAGLFSVAAVHPTQFYDAAAALAASAVAAYVLRRRLPRGAAMAAFVATYALGRAVIQPFRVVMPSEDVAPWFYPVLFVAVFATGIIVVRSNAKRAHLGARHGDATMTMASRAPTDPSFPQPRKSV
jgi:phosphatidylglycerol:prolipoprotein diacylglycerol transferase